MGSGEATDHSAKREARGTLSDDAIREQLNRILSHREFQATAKMREFLCFVVEETLAGRKHRIKGYTIATSVFGRDDDFDAAQDPIVAIQAGRLRRALERYYLVAGGRDPIRIDIPKGGYVPTFAVQITGERRLGSRPPVPRERKPEVGPTVAVVPFEDLTGDPEQLFLVTGLTEELATEMNRFQDIIVIPCHPSARRDRSVGSPVELAQSVGARFALHGSVRRDPETVKVSTHLLDTKNGRQIWSQSSTHALDASRLIATQEEIACSVVAAIGSEYGIIARRLSTESRKKSPAELDTYEAMLRYYSHQIDPSPESAMVCFTALQRAVEREPAFGPAWSALATLYCQMYSFDAPGFEDGLETALHYARRGVSLEPGSQLGRLILAYASHLVEDSETFEQEIDAAISLNPNSPYTVGAVGYFHVMRGDFDRGLPLLDRAIAVNPCHPTWFHAGYALNHVRTRDYERALAEVEKHKPFLAFYLEVAYVFILGHLGRVDEATPHAQRLREQKPDFESRARELLCRTVKAEELVGQAIEGLRRAGMAVEA